MKRGSSRIKHIDDLRKRAEKKICDSMDNAGQKSAPEIQRLIHELQVHQVELEMQNEALRKSQAESAESQQKYSDLYDFAPVGYFTFDKKGRIIEANVTGASLLGAEKRSLANQPFQRFIIAEHFSIFQSHLQKADELRSKQTCKLKLTGKDGTSFDALIDTIAVMDREGKFVHYRSAVTDITEIARAEEALRESGHKILELLKFNTTILNTSSIGILTYKESGQCTYANEAAAKISGTNVAGLLEQNFHRIQSWKKSGMYEAALKALRAGTEQKMEIQVTTTFGKNVWLSLRFSSFYSEDENHLLVFTYDITDRKQSEEELKKSVQFLRDTGEMAKVGGWELDLSTGEVLWTEEVGRIHGVEPGYKPKLEEAIKFYAPESIPALKATLKKTIETGEPYDLESLFIPSGSKDKIWVRSLGRAVYSGSKIVKIAGTFQNTDKYKRAEEELRESEENFRRSLDDSPLGIRIVTVEGETIYANRVILDIYGYESIEEMRATPVVKRYTPESFAEFQTRREKRKRGDYSPSEYDISIVRKDGEVRQLLVFRKEVLWNGERQFQVLYNDITERKGLEEILKKEQQELKLIIDSSPIIIFYKDKEGKFMRVNKTFAEKLKMPEEEFVGKTVFDLYSAKIAQAMTNDDKEVIKTGHPKLNIIEQYESASGIRWVQTHKIPICDKNGIPFGLIGFAQDITGRKRAEEETRELLLMLESVPNSIVVHDADGNFFYANQRAFDMHGYSRDEFMTLNLHRITAPASEKLIEARIEGIFDCGETSFEVEHLKKNGTILPLWINVKKVTWGGKSVFLSVQTDITERKQAEESLRESEEKYRTLVETTDTGFVIIDENGTVLDANENYIRMTGHKALDEIRNRSITEWTSRHDLERNEQAVRECLDQGFIRDLEISYVNKKGENTPVDINASVVETKEGRKIVSLCRDITERKKAEETIKASFQQLRVLAGRLQSVREEQRKQIAREIHDELGGALTGLKIDLSFLARSAPKNRDKTKRDSFLRKIREMTKLIDETIGTVRRVVTELRPSILDDFGLLAALEWQLEEFEKRTGVKCKFVSTMAYVSLDEERSTAAFRIFQEALTNVARHANATRVTATLYKEADSLVLKVKDNGKGISADDIYNPKSVGLIGMRERALFLGGTVNFSGEPSKGTTVSLQFPFKS